MFSWFIGLVPFIVIGAILLFVFNSLTGTT